MLQKFVKPQEPISSVRDLYQQRRKQAQKTKVPTKKESEARSRMWFDFEDLLDKNDEIANSGIVKLNSATSKSKIIKDLPPAPASANFFSKNSFKLNSNGKNKRQSLNWTSCEQIGGDPKFHPKDIIDIEWLPFYTWSLRFLPPVYPHVFSIPSVKVFYIYVCRN